ncbi:MAG: phenylacetate-CoA oxygenase subunit PaaJ [Oxalobacteraceae bacterium]|nr:phenylacetate-CoA oxygenase subunit PaaJ [Oxalobacteraceae bacterium]
MVRFATEQLWECLSAVSDPEIPVISVVDLGIVRELTWLDTDVCEVTITPTYSGCPAMQVIAENVELALRSLGVQKISIRTQLSPAWTTDWMSPAGREKLKAYGIAPPMQSAIDISALGSRVVPDIACPQCGSLHTRLLSQFGSTACKALYRCNECLEPFDYFKPH